MRRPIAEISDRGATRAGWALLLLLVFATTVASAQGNASPVTLSVPAELLRTLRLPGTGDEIQRPAAVFADDAHGELLVADARSNRIVIFDRDGFYRYEFGCADHVMSPVDVVVDSEGTLLVLGTTREGRRIVRFDFDGQFLSELDLGDVPIDRVTSLVIDERDRLFLLDRAGSVRVWSEARGLEGVFDVAAAVPEDVRRDLILGDGDVAGGRYFVPASTLGSVLIFDSETFEFVRSIGYRGNNPGELNFPVAAGAIGNDAVGVLDKMRFNVACFSLDGRFLGEFGGKGMRDGWFYHPTLLAVSGRDRAVVGQILDNRVQLCAIPQFVLDRLDRQPGLLRRAEGEDVRSGDSHADKAVQP